MYHTMKLRSVTIGLLFMTGIAYSSYLSNRIGYKKGLNNGFSVAIDTVYKIIDKQYKSDTTITKLVLINPDTNIYYLSRKTVLDK